MSIFNTQTLNMAATTGYVITLTTPASSVDITARGACWVRVQADGVVPTTPVATPAPSAGATCPFEYLIANDFVTFGTEPFYSSTGYATQDQTKYIVIWSETGGYLSIATH